MGSLYFWKAAFHAPPLLLLPTTLILTLFLLAVLRTQTPQGWVWRLFFGVSAFHGVWAIGLGRALATSEIKFDPAFFLTNYSEIASVFYALGRGTKFWFALLVMFLLMMATGQGLAWLCHRWNRRWSDDTRLTGIGGVGIGLALFTFAANGWEGMEQWAVVAKVREAARVVKSLTPDFGALRTQSSENVVVLMLESMNSVEIRGTQPRDAVGPYLPQMDRLAKRGVFLPFFWGNSIQTNRALYNILCGTAANLVPPRGPLPPFASPCLPALLKQSGYSTHYFLSHYDLEFGNMGNFLQAAGFENVHFGPELMGAEKPLGVWGYDDCEFYRKSFARLRELGPEKGKKEFIYLSVHLNHWPYRRKLKYPEVEVFRPAVTPRERYGNSVREQDHCLGVFVDEFERLGWPNTHLLVVGDHSMPVGERGLMVNTEGYYDEDFLVPFLYVPPRERAAEFRVGEQIAAAGPGQNDMIPTIFQLLNREAVPQSFVPLLEKQPEVGDYERCQVLIQPFHGEKILVVKGDRKWVYRVTERRLLEFPFPDPPTGELKPVAVTEGVAYETFQREHFCSRYLR